MYVKVASPIFHEYLYDFLNYVYFLNQTLDAFISMGIWSRWLNQLLKLVSSKRAVWKPESVQSVLLCT